MPLKRSLANCLLFASLFAGRLFAQSPAITEYLTPTNPSSPFGITVGPDGALWFTEQGADYDANGNPYYNIGRITTSGTVSEYPLPMINLPNGGGVSPVEGQAIAAGPDGALWFTVLYLGYLGRMTTDGTVTLFTIPSGSIAQWIVTGPDGNLWFTEQQAPGLGGATYVGKITTGGSFTEFPLLNPASLPGQITVGPDSALWFTDSGTASIGRITTGGIVTEFPLPVGASPLGIATGPDGALWFTDETVTPGNQIGRITTAGVVTEYPIITTYGGPAGIVTGPDQALWFTEFAGNIGRISTGGVVSEYPTPTGNSLPQSIVVGPDQRLWFTENGVSQIGRLQPLFSLTCNVPGSGQVGAPYTASCSAIEGAKPYTYSIVAGTLPAGLTIDPLSGAITGAPGAAGTFSFTIQAADSASPPATATFPVSNLSIAARLPTAISCNFSASAQDSVPYSASCTAGGGVPPYIFTISAGTLPPGLSLNSATGSITGTPTAYGTFSFTVQVNDSGIPVGVATQPELGFVVIPPPLKLACPLSTEAEVGVAYAGACSASGGAPPYTYSISSGALPSGLSLNVSSGSVSGTPTTAGPAPFTIAVQDSGPPVQTRSQPLPSFTVLPPVLGLTCNFTSVAKVGVPYSASCLVVNGTTPYTFSVSRGSLPPGLKLNTKTGKISGTPATFGSFSFTIQLIDSESPAQTALQIVNGFKVLPTVLTITTTTLPNGSIGLPYSGNPAAAAGVEPYSWSVTSGTLPLGLSLNAATGEITGTPTASGAYAFTLGVKDSSVPAHSAEQAFAGSISAAVAPNFTEFPALAGSGVSALVAGPDDDFWFTTADQASGNLIGQATTAGTVASYLSPNALASKPGGAGITVGPDGALWFTETDAGRIGRITTAGASIDFPLPTAAAQPQQIVVGADGALWFTELGASKIGRLTTADGVKEYSTLTAASEPLGIVAGPDDALWFTESAANKIGRITTAGTLTEFTIPTAASQPSAIAVGPDGALWFTESAAAKIGRVSTTGEFSEYATPTSASGPEAITVGPATDGALWFTELSANQIGRISTDGVITEYLIPTSASGAQSITLGPDGFVWFGENNANTLARIEFVPALTISCTASSASIQLGAAYSASCTAAGGLGSDTYSISAGALPPGVTLDPNSGAINGSPSSAGTFNFTVQVSDQSSPSQKAVQQIPALTVRPLPLLLTCTIPPSGQVGTPFLGGACSSVQGTPPYTYSIVAGSLPVGLVLDSKGGGVTGTPAAPGMFAFTIQVSDSSSPPLSVTQTALVAIKFGTTTGGGLPLFTLHGFPTTQSPGSNAASLSLQLNQAAGIAVTGTLALSFVPYAGDMGLPASGTYIDPALQFVDSSGNKLGTTYNISVPPMATTVPLPNIDPGTVAGAITASLTMDTLAETTSTFSVEPLVPQIENGSVQIVNVTSDSFDVELVANSTPRDLQYATFSFTPASGAQLLGDTTFTLDVSSLLSSWFASQEGLNYGSAFSLTVPFKLSGTANAIQSVSVTLVNTVGTSAPATGSN